MIENYKKKLKQRIENYCETNYQKVSRDQMKMGKGIFNQRCQLNAVQQVKEGLMKQVYLCICFSESCYPIVHFINKDNEGNYIDNTLGFEYEKYEYYIIREIDESEFLKTDSILMNTKKSLIKLHSNALINKVFGINEFNLGI